MRKMEFKSMNCSFVKITGMELTKLRLDFEVGSNPTVGFTINLVAFVEKLKKEEIEKLKEIIELIGK